MEFFAAVVAGVLVGSFALKVAGRILSRSHMDSTTIYEVKHQRFDFPSNWTAIPPHSSGATTQRGIDSLDTDWTLRRQKDL
mgnify:CR=1 FL=1